ncbi:MAG: hypothetical protein WAV41_04960 [Microgenomates group bacterium]
MKKIFIIVVIGVLGYFIYQYIQSPKPNITDSQADLILFHGDGCPHCKIVSDYIDANQVESKVKISYHEVYYNKSNQILLQETVKKCPEIDTTQGVGVPLAYSPLDTKCLYGDTPIIDWLKSKMLK